MSVYFDDDGVLCGNACVFIPMTAHFCYLPVNLLPDYVLERIALMKIKRGAPETQHPYDELRSGIGVWAGKSHLLISLDKDEYLHLKKVSTHANPRSKGKKGSKKDTGETQLLLF
jgi:hypothetical protein